MTINLKRLEIISKIKIPLDKESAIMKDIEDIIAYTEIIKNNHNELLPDTDPAEKTRYRISQTSEKSFDHEIILENAPQKKYDYFEVPALIERKQ
jgi:aspartyl/glutamyl-tRNA(Asn/Gln) amidotransferase C subunit